MSKKILINIFMLFLMIFSTAYAAKIDVLHYDGADYKYTGPEVTLNLNGDEFKVTEGLMPPIILENRTLVPVREVFEALGGEVEWDNTERRVDVNFGEKKISLWIDNKNAMVNGDAIEIDVPAKIINSKTMVPVRFISEKGGLNVSWDAETKTVGITIPTAKINKVEYLEIEKTKCIVVTSDTAISGYKYFMLNDTEPYRLILDVENSNFKFDTSTQTVDDELISTIRFGNQGNDINRIVLDLKKDTDYIVVPSNDKTRLYFAMAKEFIVPGEEDTNINNGETIDKETVEKIPDEKTPEEKNPENNISGDIIIDDNEISGELSGDKQTSSNSGDVNGNVLGNIISSGDNITQKPSDKGDEEKDKEEEKKEEIKEDDNQNIIIPDVYITSVKYSTSSKKVRIVFDGEIKYSDMILSNPNRIVIDIENAELKTTGPKEISIKNNVISSVRFSQYDEDAVRVVLDLNEKCDYKILERSSELQVQVTQPKYRNITYKLNSANAQITLHDVDKDDLAFSHNEDKDKYTIRFSSEDFDCGEGELILEDEFVDRITIKDSRIVIYDTGNMTYTTRQSGNNVVITVKEDERKENSNKKVILIDPGHGGSDPGACNGKNYEKVYNLNISLMLYDLLSERDDVKVYMTRDDDTYLNREDRIELASEINPDFIVSVHNNSLDNKSYTGTMVLYYNNDTESQYGDITSKECAQIVLNELLDALGTVNRGVVNREDLHILSKTPCPSILCEISFISNDAELERLKTKSFQEDAAEAIYKGVVEILEIM